MCLECTFFLSSAKILLMNELPTIPEQAPVHSLQETLLGEILANQQNILENQKTLLRAERNRRLWGIIKVVVIAILIIGPLLFLPAMMSSMMGGISPDIAPELSVNNAGSLTSESFLENIKGLMQLLKGEELM